MRANAFLLIALAGVGACFPVVPLPTSIEQGGRTGLTLAFHSTSQRRPLAPDSGAERKTHVQLGSFLTYGREADGGSAGARVTAFMHFPANVGLDAYAEAPKGWLGDVDAGLGAFWQGGVQSARGPYLSVGRTVGRRYLWITYGATHLQSARDSGYTWVRSTFFGYRSGFEAVASAFFAGVVIGPQDTRCGIDTRTYCRAATRAYVGTAASVAPRRWRARRSASNTQGARGGGAGPARSPTSAPTSAPAPNPNATGSAVVQPSR